MDVVRERVPGCLGFNQSHVAPDCRTNLTRNSVFARLVPVCGGEAVRLVGDWSSSGGQKSEILRLLRLPTLNAKQGHAQAPRYA